MICEKNGPIITNYNILITQIESKLIAQPIVHYIMVKQPLIMCWAPMNLTQFLLNIGSWLIEFWVG